MMIVNKRFIATIILGAFSFSSQAQQLLHNFETPPNTAKPRVWWHWMNGNITKEGIQKDLEWMSKAGIGGFQNFDAAMATPQVVKNRLVYMTPQWKDAFKFTTELANKLGLEMAIAGSPGWSESGGSWVSAADGMKKITWSETPVQGGTTFSGALVKPHATTGKFMNLPLEPALGDPSAAVIPDYYQDITVIAYKLPDTEVSLKELNPSITSSAGAFTFAQLTDGDLAKTSLLPLDTEKGYAWIQYAFEKPTTIKAISMVGGGDKGPFGLFGEFADTRSLEVSDDGLTFKHVCFIPAGNLVQQTIAIPATTAKFFRVTIKNPVPLSGIAAMFGIKAVAGTEIAELVLYPSSRINRFEEKAAYALSNNAYLNPTPVSADVIGIENIVDLTEKLHTDGSLTWLVPAGKWNIVRFGYALTGKQNHPATPEATGLEVDKLNPDAVKRYFDHYLDTYKDATGGLMGEKGGLQFVITDSWEAGVQNWTNNMMQEFQQRRGYNLLSWMPVLTGRLVQSAEASEQFLWDYRKTLSEMLSEYHYDQLTKLLAERGMKRYSESHESGRALLADGMEVKKNSAVPMAAMWTPNPFNNFDQTGYQADIRESASVAHIYGQNLVAAESFTAGGMGGLAYSYTPQNLKSTADLELASGLNRFVIHTSVHQPSDEKIPGISLGPFGQWFNRHETWANLASSWTSYLSRSSYLLQQGKYVADILYYYGEDNNITSLFGKKLPILPEGYSYDFVNADALMNVIQAKDGHLTTPSGMDYRVLVLDENAKNMSLPVLKKIREIAKAGVKITGIKPEKSPSLKDDVAEFQAIVAEIWTSDNVSDKAIAEVLKSINVNEDVLIKGAKAKILTVHRKTADQDIYWLNNRSDANNEAEISFRVTGKVPELWNAVTGKTAKVSYQMKEGRTIIPLRFEPLDAYFIVFKEATKQTSFVQPVTTKATVLTVGGAWQVAFQEGRGAPATTTLDKLISFTEHKNEGIHYFSGTAIYTNTFDLISLDKKATYTLDLGEVNDLAEVLINGKNIGVAWKKPFALDITSALKVGKNQLEVKVINRWVNRLVGDAQPNAASKITFTSMPFFQANSPLLPAGLLGPVTIQK